MVGAVRDLKGIPAPTMQSKGAVRAVAPAAGTSLMHAPAADDSSALLLSRTCMRMC